MAIVYPNSNPLMGGGGFRGNNFLATKLLFLIDPDEVIANVADLADEDTYLDLIAAEKLIPLGEVYSLERADVEAKFGQGQSGESIKTMPELKAFKAMLNLNEDQAKQAFQLEGKNWALIYADYGNNLKVEKSGDGFKGFELLSIYVDRKEASADVPGTTNLFFQFADTIAVEQGAFNQKMDWSLAALKPVESIVITSSVVAANKSTVTVEYVSPSYGLSDGTKRTAKITGLVAGNFEVRSNAGALRASITATESTTKKGDYEVGATGYVATDTVQVVPTVANLYKSNVAVTA